MKEFKMHPNLLRQVMEAQSGNLHKAIMEAVMNSVDAKSTQVIIDLAPDHVCISDDGRGFNGREEIERVFEVFGLPQEEEKTYGTFRMGRGQLFAKGVNLWVSGSHSMHVDIRGKGLGYELVELAEPVVGCSVSVQMYERLSPREMLYLEEELERFVKYAPIPVTLNDRRISKDLDSVKWSEETDEAYLKAGTDGTHGLQVYNLGVYVCEVPKYRFGLGGLIVSKKQLKLNFARNEVMPSCPVFKSVLKTLGYVSQKSNKNKRVVDDDMRDSIASSLMSGDYKWHEYFNTGLFTDITGHKWSFTRLNREKFLHWSTAPMGDLAADCMIQSRTAFVMPESMFEVFQYKGKPEGFFKHIFSQGNHYDFRPTYKKFSDLAQEFTYTHTLIDDKKLSVKMKKILTALERGAYWMLRKFPGEEYALPSRNLRLGISQTAEGWTDGENYIALEKSFVEKCGTRFDGFMRMSLVILHEYCHRESDQASHNHDDEFYRNYHDASHRVPKAAQNAYIQYLAAIESEVRKIGSKKQKLDELRMKGQDLLESQLETVN